MRRSIGYPREAHISTDGARFYDCFGNYYINVAASTFYGTTGNNSIQTIGLLSRLYRVSFVLYRVAILLKLLH